MVMERPFDCALVDSNSSYRSDLDVAMAMDWVNSLNADE